MFDCLSQLERSGVARSVNWGPLDDGGFEAVIWSDPPVSGRGATRTEAFEAALSMWHGWLREVSEDFAKRLERAKRGEPAPVYYCAWCGRVVPPDCRCEPRKYLVQREGGS
jgi:hypothetical protein